MWSLAPESIIHFPPLALSIEDNVIPANPTRLLSTSSSKEVSFTGELGRFLKSCFSC